MYNHLKVADQFRMRAAYNIANGKGLKTLLRDIRATLETEKAERLVKEILTYANGHAK